MPIYFLIIIISYKFFLPGLLDSIITYLSSYHLAPSSFTAAIFHLKHQCWYLSTSFRPSPVSSCRKRSCPIFVCRITTPSHLHQQNWICRSFASLSQLHKNRGQLSHPLRLPSWRNHGTRWTCFIMSDIRRSFCGTCRSKTTLRRRN